ncbi:MAG: hypothetical protein NZ933_09185, partial [Bacteroidia bacterium]|nr:hypothetical protein [Bacteroidia bacterium]
GAYREQLGSIIREISELECRVQQLEKASLAKELQEVKAACENLQNEWQKLSHEEGVLHEREKNLRIQLKEAEEELAYRTRQQEELSSEANFLREKFMNAERLLSESQSKLATLQALHINLLNEVRQYEEALRLCESERSTLLMDLRQVQAQQENLSIQLQSLQARLDSYAAELVELENRLLALEQEKSVLEAEKETTGKSIQRLSALLSVWNSYQDALAQERQRITRSLQAVQNFIQHTHAQRRALEELFAQPKGEPSYLSALRSQIPFWRTEDIFFAEDKYLPLLSLLIQLEPPTLWVRSKAEAETLHQHLSAQKEGFFCVRVFSPERKNSLTSQKWSGIFYTLKEFEGLADYLWGDVEIGEVPGEGRVIHPNGRLLWLVDGCVYALSSSLPVHIGLPHRIQRLLMEEEHAFRRKQRLEEFLKDIGEKLNQIPFSAIKRELHEKEGSFRQIEKKLEVLEARREEVLRRQQKLRNEVLLLNEQKKHLESQTYILHEKEKSVSARLSEVQDTIERNAGLVSQIRQNLQNTTRELADQRFKVVRLEN